jgi:sugar lactone lactonase YvrE
VSSTGNCVGVAGRTGTSGSTDGQGINSLFYMPSQLTMSTDGTAMYVADSYNHVIRFVTTSGNLVVCVRLVFYMSFIRACFGLRWYI